MSVRFDNARLLLGAVVMLAVAVAGAQGTPAAVPAPVPQAPTQSGVAVSSSPAATNNSNNTAPLLKPAAGVVVDQVIGVVNGDLILESDIDEERRFEAFEPFSTPGTFSRDRAIERLIDRTLIIQQAKLQPDQLVSTAEAKAQLQSLRKDLPACKEYHCETDAGWERFVHDQGFTMDELVSRWQQRMEILKFIEMRFRAGIEISPAQIKAYYETTMLPEYARVKAPPPPVETISDRIQEVLLEQQVSALLSDWLKSLKAQGAVRMMRPDEVQP
jgi:peptidyl-prolyl cis-trans isomerase SurA